MLNNFRSPSPPRHGGFDTSRTSSFRVYYGGSSGSIPFKWESAPGTPIHVLNSITGTSSSVIPPLAPPPSFRFADDSKAIAWARSKVRPSFVIRILQKLKRSVRNVSPVHSSNSMTSSFSSSSIQSSVRKTGYFRVGQLCGSVSRCPRPASELHSGGEYFDEDKEVSRTASFNGGYSETTLRFKEKKRRFGGCFGI